MEAQYGEHCQDMNTT